MTEPEDGYEEIVDPFSLLRPAPVTETRVFVNEARRRKMTLTFSAESDHSLMLRVLRKADEYVETFIHGRPERDGSGRPTGRRSVAPLRPVGGRPITPDPDLFYKVAVLEALEVKPEGRRKYDVFDWAALSVTDNSMFTDISLWGASLLDRASGEASDLPNDSGAASESI